MDKYLIWVQFETDVDDPVNLGTNDILDILHDLRKSHIVDICDDRDIVVKLVEDA
jgi:hypothetical protein